MVNLRVANFEVVDSIFTEVDLLADVVERSPLKDKIVSCNSFLYFLTTVDKITLCGLTLVTFLDITVFHSYICKHEIIIKIV